MKKTFFAAIAAMLIFAVAGSGNVFAGGKLADNSIKEKSRIVSVNKTEKVSTKTTAVSGEKKVVVAGEKKMVKRHHRSNRISKKSVK